MIRAAIIALMLAGCASHNMKDTVAHGDLDRDGCIAYRCQMYCKANTSTAQVICYVGDNATGVVLKDASGTSSFTTDFALGFTAPGKCAITVKLTVDGGGTTVATFTL